MHFILSDLPPVRMLPEFVLIELITILEPEPTINFTQQKPKPKDVSEETYEWFQKKWPTDIITSCKTHEDFTTLLNSIPSNENSKTIIQYLTTLLSLPCISSSDFLMDKITRIISSYCGSSTASDTVRLFKLSDNQKEAIKIVERGITNDLIGWKTWGTSLPFSKRLMSDDSIFQEIQLDQNKKDNNIVESKKNYKILELGSGTGLAGISILQKLFNCQNFELYLTDLPEIVPNLEKNIYLNHPLSENVHILPLDWMDYSGFIEKMGSDIKFDFVVVCDCLYAPEHPGLVVNTVKQFLKKNGQLLLELPLRPKFEEERKDLWQLLTKNKFVKIREEFDHGVDDFGESSYIYQNYKKNT
ncbi:hypothetical protein HANVADRAFT_46802 [Hanseniaspora valbyensis NRRL Y-1626]|uniref:S-adenosyl-L-methionine-dependent methyltransferase n=1 Tax=Hanseniaspora valbyensis NRRL Y-1626 TaxID=766949 RepID=A0A1B7TKC6_9ASCO|nr:hypothetical protein HANVADRAFT_46802 [Hanseniaspora valbyensis NRRL Y-1626]